MLLQSTAMTVVKIVWTAAAGCFRMPVWSNMFQLSSQNSVASNAMLILTRIERAGNGWNVEAPWRTTVLPDTTAGSNKCIRLCEMCTHKAIQTRPCPPASHPEHPRWCQYLLPSTHETWWAGACNTLTADGSRGWGGTESGLRVKHYCTSEVTKGHATVKPAPAAYQDQI